MRLVKILFSIVLCAAVCGSSAVAAWKKQSSGTLAWLHAVYFTNEKQGWIVGSRGTLLQTTDGGETWRGRKIFVTDNLRDVYFTDERNGWILCERDLYASGSSPVSYLLKTSDGGESWAKADLTGDRERIARLFFSKSGSGFAVGEAGTYLAQTDDKTKWKKSVLPARFLMLDGSFTDDWRGALVGGGGTILFTEDGGLSWNPATLAGGAKPKLNSVFFINQKTGWTAGAIGKIYFTMNGGKFWHEQNSGVGENLNDIFFLDSAEGFAVGDEGTILHTTTGGNTWKTEASSVAHKLERIHFAGRKGFAVGFGGTILKYESEKPGDVLPKKPRLQNRAER